MDTYTDTHVSVLDGSPAMLVSQEGGTITLVNESGDQWTDPAALWQPVDAPVPLAALIMAYEEGDLSPAEQVEMFSRLVKTGMAWSLQGSYGRAAVALMEGGILSGEGEVLVDVEDL